MTMLTMWSGRASLSRKISLSKLGAALLLSIPFILSPVGLWEVGLAVLVFTACSTLFESVFTIGIAHPTPTYRRSRQACDKCKLMKDDECTNVRMLDGFETEFRSKEGTFRPVCCCGFRIGDWREVHA